MKISNPFSLKNIESKAEKKFRLRTFKEEYKDHRFAAMVFKILFSTISIYFATYFFHFFFFKSLVPNQATSSTISTNWLTDGSIWMISSIVPIGVEVIKHLSVPIVVNSIIRNKWGKTVIPLLFSVLTIGASYYFTIEGSAYIFDNEDSKMSDITANYKIQEDSIRNYYGKEIENEKQLLKELQDNTKDKSLIYSTIQRIDKLENEYASTRSRMEKSLRINQNKDSVRAYFKPLLVRIETKIKDEKERSDGLLSSNEKITMNTILTIENLQKEQEEELKLLDTAQKDAKDTLKTDNHLLLEYIYIIALSIETLILLCIIFISYYDYQIVRRRVEDDNITILIQKNEALKKELSKAKVLFEKTILGETPEKQVMVPLKELNNGTIKNGTGTTILKNGTKKETPKRNYVKTKKEVKKSSAAQREIKIAYLLKEGYTYAQIVEKLGVSKRDIAKVKKGIA